MIQLRDGAITQLKGIEELAQTTTLAIEAYNLVLERDAEERDGHETQGGNG